jgi:hypothetical protein
LGQLDKVSREDNRRYSWELTLEVPVMKRKINRKGEPEIMDILLLRKQ